MKNIPRSYHTEGMNKENSNYQPAYHLNSLPTYKNDSLPILPPPHPLPSPPIPSHPPQTPSPPNPSPHLPLPYTHPPYTRPHNYNSPLPIPLPHKTPLHHPPTATIPINVNIFGLRNPLAACEWTVFEGCLGRGGGSGWGRE